MTKHFFEHFTIPSFGKIARFLYMNSESAEKHEGFAALLLFFFN